MHTIIELLAKNLQLLVQHRVHQDAHENRRYDTLKAREREKEISFFGMEFNFERIYQSDDFIENN